MTASAAKTSLADPRAWSAFLMPALGIGAYAIQQYLGAKMMEEQRALTKVTKELEEVREGRDAAIATAAQVFKLIEHFTAVEKFLREKLKAAEDALKKEREESMEVHHKNFEARQNLERANEDWKRKHQGLEELCAQLEAKLKEKKTKKTWIER
jgi:hypothetical protein